MSWTKKQNEMTLPEMLLSLSELWWKKYLSKVTLVKYFVLNFLMFVRSFPIIPCDAKEIVILRKTIKFWCNIFYFLAMFENYTSASLNLYTWIILYYLYTWINMFSLYPGNSLIPLCFNKSSPITFVVKIYQYIKWEEGTFLTYCDDPTQKYTQIANFW